MILLAAIGLGATTVVLGGGSFRRMRDPGFRGISLLWAALGLQLLITVVAVAAIPVAVAEVIHLASYGLAVVWVGVNLHVPGLRLTAAGGGANLVAIAANGGVMPARPGALAAAGFPPATDAFTNSGAVEGARLAFLGDVFAIPEAWPLSNVFSIGDVLLVVGGTAILHHLTGSRWVRSGVGSGAAPGDGTSRWRVWGPALVVTLLAVGFVRDAWTLLAALVALGAVVALDPRGPAAPWLARPGGPGEGLPELSRAPSEAPAG